MAPSQLKMLKQSLRDRNSSGKQQLKGPANKRLSRREGVAKTIEDQFNPFDVKRNPRGPKFQATSLQSSRDHVIQGRPAISRASGEQKRRETLLVEMQRGNKVGAIIDRRFGENDPNMPPEEKMLHRFALEKQRAFKKQLTFDLEMESLPDVTPDLGDDYVEDDLESHSDEASNEPTTTSNVAPLLVTDDNDARESMQRKRTKAEVMQEVIAKAKLHKLNRQALKQDNEEMRDVLDRDSKELLHLMKLGGSQDLPSQSHPEIPKSFTQIKSNLREDFEATAPSTKVQTKEEKLDQHRAQVEELEAMRLQRMHGATVSGDNDLDDVPEDNQNTQPLGLFFGSRIKPTATELNIADEHDFMIEDDLVASDSDMELAEDYAPSDSGNQASNAKDHEMSPSRPSHDPAPQVPAGKLLPCPQTHAELLQMMKQTHSAADLIPTIQMIRAQHHPSLAAGNHQALAKFSQVLVKHLAFTDKNGKRLCWDVVDMLIRQIHSMAKSYPAEVADSFRSEIERMTQGGTAHPSEGDMALLGAVSCIFPTSDHFHQVVTPAMLAIARFMGHRPVSSLAECANVLFLATLAHRYQCFSKRFIPEAIGSCMQILAAVCPMPFECDDRLYSFQKGAAQLRLGSLGPQTEVKILAFEQIFCPTTKLSPVETASLQVSLLATASQLVVHLAEMWLSLPAIQETISTTLGLLSHILSNKSRACLPESLVTCLEGCQRRLNTFVADAQKARRPLELHHHRPYAIRTSIPKFEDSFDPNKHYDPDSVRSELVKLRKEYKREHKGALRELRKDANFIAREKLKAKISKDQAYNQKFNRLIARVQADAGHDSNAYEREKVRRKKDNKRRT